VGKQIQIAEQVNLDIEGGIADPDSRTG